MTVLENIIDNTYKDLKRLEPGEFPFALVELDGFKKWFTTNGNFWTEGFWIGKLVDIWKLTGDKTFLDYAFKNYQFISRRKEDTTTHDLGFLFYHSAWKIKEYFPVVRDIKQAVCSLMKRYNAKYNLISAWFSKELNSEVFIVDTFMNLILPFDYYTSLGDKENTEKIVEIAKTMCNLFIGNHGNVLQAFVEGENGLKPVKIQGKSPTSCWSRGFAWALYGCAWFWKRTRMKIFAEAFNRMINYLEEREYFPYIPYDFEDVKSNITDSSAAVIISCALALGRDITVKSQSISRKIIAWIKNECLTEDDRLIHGCYHYPKRQFIDNELIFGDYYFLMLMKEKEENK